MIYQSTYFGADGKTIAPRLYGSDTFHTQLVAAQVFAFTNATNLVNYATAVFPGLGSPVPAGAFLNVSDVVKLTFKDSANGDKLFIVIPAPVDGCFNFDGTVNTTFLAPLITSVLANGQTANGSNVDVLVDAVREKFNIGE